jgi:hypothetical protein
MARALARIGTLALLLTPLAVAHPAAAAAPPTPTFNPNLLIKGSSGTGEPSIRTDHAGIPFVIGPTGVGGGCKAFRVAHDGSSSQFLGFPDHQAGGGDCDWAVGPHETGSTHDVLVYSSLSLANLTTGKSTDGGSTFGPPNPYSQQVGGDDREWMAADPKLNAAGMATIYMTYHDVSALDIELGVSIDGGFSYIQSGPIINNADVPAAQWQGAALGATGAGNELGNLVSRRDPATGALTLYSIFITPDSSTDSTNQALAGTGNFNRVYEAVGAVTDTTTYPTISWRNYEVFHGLLGSRYNRIFPVTTVDSAGHVGAIWTDGNHIDFKSSSDGRTWDPAAQPTLIDKVAGGYPAANNTAIMPWAEAGRDGIVDVVWYGASGGAGAQPNPQDDPANVWNVYMAQTVDGGATWTAAAASDHVIHTGPICIDGLNCDTGTPKRNRTLLDFFQVSIDPTNGAADITFADDHGSPGSASLYFTRQCTGTSATTGAALVNDCHAPGTVGAPPAATTCPGPQIKDFTGDAPNVYPGGDGKNMDNLDLVSGAFLTPDSSHISVALTINNLSTPPPPANLVSAIWTAYWTYAGTTYFAQANSTGPVVTYRDGTYDGSFHTKSTITGAFIPGKNGRIILNIPRADVGNPPNGAVLSNPYADTHGAFLVNGSGVYYTAAADRAPDSGYGAPYTVGQTCGNTGGGGGGEGDSGGDIQDQNGNTSHEESDADTAEDGKPDGVSAHDAGSGKDFHSTSVTSVVRDTTNGTVMVVGQGLENGVPVEFTAVFVKSAEYAIGYFSLSLSDGTGLSGKLLNGTVEL